MRKIRLAMGAEIPVLGQGTWKMGESAANRSAEVRALQLGIDAGMNLIDTAEMYADGGAESVVGEAITGRRDGVFIVSKVLPGNAGRRETVAACERSLKRMRIDCIDLYLLHWRGAVPLSETLLGLRDLVAAGKIRSFGVSNFDIKDMAEWLTLDGASSTQVNQVMYNVRDRGIDFDLIPWCRQRHIAIMAYSPLAEGQIRSSPALERVARRHDATVAQIMLAWCLRHPMVFAIPKSSNADRVRQNARASDILLTDADLAEIAVDFPPPPAASPLAMT